MNHNLKNVQNCSIFRIPRFIRSEDAVIFVKVFGLIEMFEVSRFDSRFSSSQPGLHSRVYKLILIYD